MGISFNSDNPLTVEEIDLTPTVSGVSTIKVSNGTLVDDGGGTVTVTTGGGTPAGVNTNVQYNNAGSFGGAASITTDGTDLSIADDSYINFGSASEFRLRYNTTGGRFQISDSGGNVFMSITDSGTTAITNLNDLDINSSGLTGKLTIQGDGTTSATTQIITEDSSNTERFKLTDDGTITINNAYSLPTVVTGTNDFVLTAQTDGSTAWAAAGGGGATTLDDLNNVSIYDGTANATHFSMVMANGASGDGVAVDSFNASSRSNLGIMSGAGNSITSAFGCVCIGLNAGTAITTGNYNIAIGYQALVTEDTNSSNVAIGVNAGYTQNGGTSNTYVGSGTGVYNVTGDYNTCIGASAGHQMLYRYNTVVGFQAGYWLGDGGASSGQYVTAVGVDAGKGTNNMTGAGEDVFIGYRAGFAITTGAYNTVLGAYAGDGITQGEYNIIMGHNSGDAITTGDKNICIGVDADCAATVDDQISIGYSTTTTGQYGIALGNNITAASDRFVMGRASNTMTNDFTTSNTWTQASDERKKTNIKDDALGLSFINRLQPKTYTWKAAKDHPEAFKAYDIDKDGVKVYHQMNTETVMHGLLAQDVKKALDNENCKTFAGWKEYENSEQGISKEMFIFPLINAVKELSEKVKALEKHTLI